MSTEENKEVERRVFKELTKHNLALVNELIDTRWLYHGPGGSEVDVQGHDGFREFHTMLFNAFPDIHFTIEDMVAEGDKVVVRFTVRGTHKGDYLGVPPTGKQFAVNGIAIHRIVDGREVEVWDSVDIFAMMQQLGVIPPPGGGGK